MKKTFKTLSNGAWMLQSCLVVILFAAWVIPSKAQDYTLTTGDTSLQVNLASPNAGLSQWTIGGINQLEQEWYYLSVAGGAVNSIDTIPTLSTPVLNGGSAPSVSEMYTSNLDYSVSTTYTLTSLSSSVAQLGTQVAIQNLSSQTQSFNFYQYSDFWLGGVSTGQDFEIVPSGSTTVYQFPTSGAGYLEETVDAGLGVMITETAALYNGTQLGLENGNPPPNFTDPIGVIGPGNINFGYEFTANLAPGAGMSFSTIQTVPESSSLAFISSGILVLALLYRRGFAFLKNVKTKA